MWKIPNFDEEPDARIFEVAAMKGPPKSILLQKRGDAIKAEAAKKKKGKLTGKDLDTYRSKWAASVI